MPEMVKGAEKFLKSRSKPARTSAKVSEIRPINLGEGLLQVNSKHVNDKLSNNESDSKNFGLVNIVKLNWEERPNNRNQSRVLNHRKVFIYFNF